MNFLKLLIVLIPVFSYGQFEEYIEKDPEPLTMDHRGGMFSLMEAGYAFGFYYEKPFINFIHFGLSIDIIKIRDKDQIEIYDPYYQYTYTLNKINDVWMFNLLTSVKKRLFPRSFHDSFRPFINAAIGPLYGINFPVDEFGNDRPNPHEWILTGAIGGGLDVDFEAGFYGGIKAQYRYMMFDQKMGERKNHSTIDIRFEIGQRF